LDAGSAGCTAIRKSHGETNNQLAQERAATVQTKLLEEHFLKDGNIKATFLHQHDNCGQSKDLRAVFPVLVQLEH
jgi:DNA helicase IV